VSVIEWVGGMAGAHEALAVALEEASAGLASEADAGAPSQFRVYRELGDLADPPAVYLSPPELTWSLLGSDPTEAVFSAALVVQADDRAVARLYALVPIVVQALDSVIDANVKTATPGTWEAGNATLPCYFMRIEVALR
jgi:hypothetical protein